MKESLEAAKKVLEADKENPDALTIAGLAAWHLNMPGVAKMHFTALAASDPGSVLAENNLGVVCFALKQPAEGIYHYGKALQIMPDNRLLLDNIVEALNAYQAGGDLKAETYKALVRGFEPAEKRMQERLAGVGMVRLGSTWVDKGALDERVSSQRALLEQLAQLAKQFGELDAAVKMWEAQALQADADYNASLAAIVLQNAAVYAAPVRGNSQVNFIAAQSLAVQNANHFLALRAQYLLQRDQAAAASRDVQEQMVRIQQTLDAGKPRYTGSQRIMEVGEGENPPAPAVVN
jgi:tetratricopeptide (TPR) repeat protein